MRLHIGKQSRYSCSVFCGISSLHGRLSGSGFTLTGRANNLSAGFVLVLLDLLAAVRCEVWGVRCEVWGVRSPVYGRTMNSNCSLTMLILMFPLWQKIINQWEPNSASGHTIQIIYLTWYYQWYQRWIIVFYISNLQIIRGRYLKL